MDSGPGAGPRRFTVMAGAALEDHHIGPVTGPTLRAALIKLDWSLVDASTAYVLQGMPDTTELNGRP